VSATSVWGRDGLQGTTTATRSAAFQMIERKLSGQARIDAMDFVRNRHRREAHLISLIERLEQKPDLEKECHSRAMLTDSQAMQLIRESLAGDSTAVLAERYGVKPGTAAHISKGRSRPRLYEQVMEERET